MQSVQSSKVSTGVKMSKNAIKKLTFVIRYQISDTINV